MPFVPATKQPHGYIRFLYAYPEIRCISICIDDKPIKKKWYYEDFTKYLKIRCGYHTICFKDTQTGEILLEKKLSIKPGAFFTYIYINHPKQVEIPYLYGVEDLPRKFLQPQAFVRIGHFSLNQAHVDFQLKDDRLLYKHLHYLQVSRHLPMECTQSFFQIYDSAASDTLLTAFKHTLKPGRIYTFYLLGDGSKSFPYHALISIDGPSFFSIEKDMSPGNLA